jgi:hypothetical protein
MCLAEEINTIQGPETTLLSDAQVLPNRPSSSKGGIKVAAVSMLFFS